MKSTNFNRPKYENTRPNTQRILICIVIVFSSLFLTAQNKQDYYIVAKPNYSMEPIQKTTNPASNSVTISYDAAVASSAYLIITNIASGIFNNYILDTAEFQATLDISAYPTGLYSVALVCDGEIQQSKTLVKE